MADLPTHAQNLRRRTSSTVQPAKRAEGSQGAPGRLNSRKELVVLFILPTAMSVLGISTTMLSLAYSHTCGLLAGLTAFIGGVSLSGARHPPKLTYMGGIPAAAGALLVVYLLLLVLVRMLSFDPLDFPHSHNAVVATARSGGSSSSSRSSIFSGDSFPDKCEAIKEHGCVRVATTRSHPDQSATALKFHVPLQDAVRVVKNWVEAQRGGVILRDRWTYPKEGESFIAVAAVGGGGQRTACNVFVHSRAMTFLMGFIDDVYVQLECVKGPSETSEGYAQISIQSQNRLGISDFGVNEKRVKELTSFLETSLREIPQEDCTRSLSRPIV
eukprot:TRINITY_DN8466_c2_g1_i1.p1 TRINITY_DN8466_c2_g1~~TRINITY_DN8466_c2_g1_i1.p1  ORF type:complete len:337 (+),score=67.60 TRINITY_DN8466_c2_g1_i1:29-1012(+)